MKACATRRRNAAIRLDAHTPSNHAGGEQPPRRSPTRRAGDRSPRASRLPVADARRRAPGALPPETPTASRAVEMSDVDRGRDQQRRNERRVGRPFDPALDQRNRDDVTAAKRRDRVHPYPRRVGAEHAPPANRTLRIGGGEDVPPGATPGRHLGQLAARAPTTPASTRSRPDGRRRPRRRRGRCPRQHSRAADGAYLAVSLVGTFNREAPTWSRQSTRRSRGPGRTSVTSTLLPPRRSTSPTAGRRASVRCPVETTTPSLTSSYEQRIGPGSTGRA